MKLDELSGTAFLALATRQELHCSATTIESIPQLGTKGVGCLEAFGAALNVLSGAAGCRWGCSSGDHLVEYLLGRGASSAHAGYRLMMHGFYDEALGLARGLGELANLMLLFGADPSAFAAWRASDRKERLGIFSPVKVRLRLESLKVAVGVQEDRYGALCEEAIHVTPSTRPNTHSPDAIPRLGAHFQPVGALVALNELAFGTALVMAAAAPLLTVRDSSGRLSTTAVALLRSIGGVTVLNRQEGIDSLRKMESHNREGAT
jgi:hypothetical protein